MEGSGNYRGNIVKWLPFMSSDLESWFNHIVTLHEAMDKCARDIAMIIEDVQGSMSISDKEVFLRQQTKQLGTLVQTYSSIWSDKKQLAIANQVYKYKIEYLSSRVKRSLNIVAKFCRNLIFEIIVDCCKDEGNFTRLLFGLIQSYNDALDLDCNVSSESTSVNIYSNDCPSMLEPLKKISITRILQVLAKNKAEENCHELIDCLLMNYQPRSEENLKSSQSWDVEMSENSSIEIYRALTKHMTPPGDPPAATEENIADQTEPTSSGNIESIESLVDNQTLQVDKLMDAIRDVYPQLFGLENIKYDCRGETKVRRSALTRLSDYYQHVAWAAISGILDHVVLWWSPEGLAARHSQGAHHLKDWLRRFIQTNEISSSVRPALLNLCDALGCHVTATGWDELFRLAYIASFECSSKPFSSEGTDTGQMFAELFQLLVTLSNECEIGGEWVVGAPLVELPLSEQIIVLHRLDHSVHTMRLWAIQESKLIAHTWDLETFFLLVKGDLVACIDELSYLKLSDHTSALSINATSVEVYVCAKMRAKIVSEVNANIQLLKETPIKCINTLATICRVVSLANLHMCFPISKYWRRNSSAVVAVGPTPYVETYLQRVLLPVLEVIEDHEVSNMVLKIMCEAWLDYIYLHRIKFSEFGALQLLTDFAHVSRWVTDCPIISQTVKGHLLKNELLRRCEGVGRLLLRHPGEAIAMQKQSRTNENGSPQSLGLERMPAEMYVPNQQQWLELRASKSYKLYCCTD
ncbi:coiled-coil domain-containing protein 142 [Diachasmimorpha longicaudata]|uniref:coiled-coil domain-containing protein 142 n=1 Tax=Diachasmimorpha longicaudata TaxID=58733 RepID=UPI0030B8F529